MRYRGGNLLFFGKKERDIAFGRNIHDRYGGLYGGSPAHNTFNYSFDVADCAKKKQMTCIQLKTGCNLIKSTEKQINFYGVN